MLKIGSTITSGLSGGLDISLPPALSPSFNINSLSVSEGSFNLDLLVTYLFNVSFINASSLSFSNGQVVTLENFVFSCSQSGGVLFSGAPSSFTVSSYSKSNGVINMTLTSQTINVANSTDFNYVNPPSFESVAIYNLSINSSSSINSITSGLGSSVTTLELIRAATEVETTNALVYQLDSFSVVEDHTSGVNSIILNVGLEFFEDLTPPTPPIGALDPELILNLPSKLEAYQTYNDEEQLLFEHDFTTIAFPGVESIPNNPGTINGILDYTIDDQNDLNFPILQKPIKYVYTIFPDQASGIDHAFYENGTYTITDQKTEDTILDHVLYTNTFSVDQFVVNEDVNNQDQVVLSPRFVFDFDGDALDFNEPFSVNISCNQGGTAIFSLEDVEFSYNQFFPSLQSADDNVRVFTCSQIIPENFTDEQCLATPSTNSVVTYTVTIPNGLSLGSYSITGDLTHTSNANTQMDHSCGEIQDSPILADFNRCIYTHTLPPLQYTVLQNGGFSVNDNVEATFSLVVYDEDVNADVDTDFLDVEDVDQVRIFLDAIGFKIKVRGFGASDYSTVINGSQYVVPNDLENFGKKHKINNAPVTYYQFLISFSVQDVEYDQDFLPGIYQNVGQLRVETGDFSVDYDKVTYNYESFVPSTLTSTLGVYSNFVAQELFVYYDGPVFPTA